MEDRIAGCVAVRTDVKGRNGRPSSTLVVNGDYGHGVELYANYALWPVPVVVSCEIRQEGQIGFDRGDVRAWDFFAELPPKRGIAEQARLLKCVGRKTGRDHIDITFLVAEKPKETLSIELTIENSL